MKLLKILIFILCLFISLNSAFCQKITVNRKNVNYAGKSFAVKVVSVPLDSYQVKVGLANGRVGSTAPLASIVKSNNAIAGINGCFFNAYTKDSVKPPYHHLITNGELVHSGNTGTTIGFDADGNHRMDRLKITLKGGLNNNWKYPDNWYAYFINHPVENSTTAVIYTRYWVGSKTPAKGCQAVVKDGVVQASNTCGNPIPKNGFVALFSGGESNLAGRLKAGLSCNWKIEYQAEDCEFWKNVREAIGCGPRLIKNGEIAYNPLDEGFSSSKILNASGQRSAVGVTKDRKLLLVTCAATVKNLAYIMKELGAYDAMNLDGGASSCLWANGNYLTSPGRNISNALLIVKR